MPIDPEDPRFDDLVSQLSLEEKVLLLTGQDFWSTVALPNIGLRSLVLSDGPSGVRGPVWDERSPSLNLPSGTALAASWDAEIAREYGDVSAAEARRKGVDVVLGPTVNLHRSPLGGRHFEAFSEDPLLTGALASAYVQGVQRNGVAATLKHYVANDFETERFTADVAVDDRALRELYLLAFEQGVTEARVWAVMSAYNSINGATASENPLLADPLNDSWGFDGVVVSDWTGVRSIESARHEQDLAMPGPVGAWGDALVGAVRQGEVEEGLVDRKVRRLLVLAARVGALDGFPASAPVRPVDGMAFARRAAAAGMVLLANDGILPVASAPHRIAVIGQNALHARTQGGGSATVLPERVVSPLEGIRSAFPDSEVEFALGAVVDAGLNTLPIDQLRNPATGAPGIRVEFLDEVGEVLFAEDRRSTALVWFGGDAPVAEAAAVVLRTTWTPTESGPVRLGFASVGRGVIAFDGVTVVDEETQSEGLDLGAAFLMPPIRAAEVAATVGAEHAIELRFTRMTTDDGLSNALSLTLGLQADASDPERDLVAAEALAAGADLTVVVVGTNSAVESEGFDRTDLRLPGAQDALVARVAAANPRTVVIVNAGAPVELPWADDVAAILLGWFGGQEFGSAIGDVLTGAAEPGGRLPTTWAKRLEDAPVFDVTPRAGIVRYEEGIHIGYRAWLKHDRAPAYWFGHGLGYTTWQLEQFSAEMAGSTIQLAASVRNTGSRGGKHIVQFYASRAASAVARPVRWLVGWAPVRADAGDLVEVELELPLRRLAHWDGDWVLEPGSYTIEVGRDAAHPLGDVAVTIGGS